MKTPRNGSRMQKSTQPVLPTPEMSWRRKMSANTVNRSQNQRIQRKKMNIVHITSRNG